MLTTWWFSLRPLTRCLPFLLLLIWLESLLHYKLIKIVSLFLRLLLSSLRHLGHHLFFSHVLLLATLISATIEYLASFILCIESILLSADVLWWCFFFFIIVKVMVLVLLGINGRKDLLLLLTVSPTIIASLVSLKHWCIMILLQIDPFFFLTIYILLFLGKLIIQSFQCNPSLHAAIIQNLLLQNISIDSKTINQYILMKGLSIDLTHIPR